MVGQVTRNDVRRMVADQLRIDLPSPLILMDAHIQQYGAYRVPLNLATRAGQPIELSLNVIRARRM